MATGKIFRDGNAFCAVMAEFKNLQESEAGFGKTRQEAHQNLIGLIKESPDLCILYGFNSAGGNPDFEYDKFAKSHDSDCALHKGPAQEPGPCDCGADPGMTPEVYGSERPENNSASRLLEDKPDNSAEDWLLLANMLIGDLQAFGGSKEDCERAKRYVKSHGEARAAEAAKAFADNAQCFKRALKALYEETKGLQHPASVSNASKADWAKTATPLDHAREMAHILLKE